MFEAHVDFVWRVLRQHGVPERELEDACQEVFLAAHRKWVEVEERRSARAWLASIAVQVARATRPRLNVRRRLINAPYGKLDAAVERLRDEVPSETNWVESVTTGKRAPVALDGTHPHPLEPGIEARARMFAQLEGALGAASAVTAPGAAKLFGWTVALGISVLLGGVGLLLQHGADAVRAARASDVGSARVGAPSPLPPASAPTAPGPTSMPQSSSSEPPRGERPSARAATRHRAARLDHRTESALLEAAQRALATRAAYALELTAEHARAYPQSNLAEQRELISIEALRVLGRTSAARARARSFEQSFPASDARARLLRALGPD